MLRLSYAYATPILRLCSTEELRGWVEWGYDGWCMMDDGWWKMEDGWWKRGEKRLTSKNLCQFCWLALKQKPPKPHFWDRNSSEFLTLSALILLVCEHPDSLITNIVTLSGISISSWKNPAFDFVEPVLARHTENKFSSVLAYSRLWRKNSYSVRKRKPKRKLFNH